MGHGALGTYCLLEDNLCVKDVPWCLKATESMSKDSNGNEVYHIAAISGNERRIRRCLACLEAVPCRLMVISFQENHEGGDNSVVADLFVLINRNHPGV